MSTTSIYRSARFLGQLLAPIETLPGRPNGGCILPADHAAEALELDATVRIAFDDALPEPLVVHPLELVRSP